MRILACALVVVCGWNVLSACDAEGGRAAADSGVAAPADVRPDASPDTAAPPPCTPLKLDVLWVVDASPSMCQEQAALAEGISTFVTALRTVVGNRLDVRVAVTTPSVLDEERAGAFNTEAAREFPPICQERRPFPALEDADCACAECDEWDPESAAFLACRAADPPGCDDRFAAKWAAEPPQGGATFLYNGNGTVNASCRFVCGGAGASQEDADAECREYFEDETMVCQVPGGLWGNAGCVRPPATSDCPDELPGVLPDYDLATGEARRDLDSFRCIATVGASQDVRAGLEQGLKGAWLALDPEGPRALQVCDPDDPLLAHAGLSTLDKRELCGVCTPQHAFVADATLPYATRRALCACSPDDPTLVALEEGTLSADAAAAACATTPRAARLERRFLRDGAALLIVFVSDEDDCSVDDAKTIAIDDYNKCSLLGDADTPPEDVRATGIEGRTSDRPLAPVGTYVARYRGLKPSPDDVYVAALTGDALAPDGTPLTGDALAAAREAYYDSKAAPTATALSTYICAGADGRADLGMRYLDLVAQFGDHGFGSNICASEGLSGAFTWIAGALAEECPQ